VKKIPNVGGTTPTLKLSMKKSSDKSPIKSPTKKITRENRISIQSVPKEDLVKVENQYYKD